jgi:GTP-binding protein
MIKTATFVKSSAREQDSPTADKAEFAFIGRSNVGKSSLVNMLTGRKKLAKVSGTPGKTQLINHFLINDAWYLVDLPGYGYARVGKKEKAKWSDMVADYLVNRQNLLTVFVLIDSRLEPQKIDVEFITWLGEAGIPFVMVFTKIDKLTRNELQSSVAGWRKKLKEDWEELPRWILTSSETSVGRDELLTYIEEIRNSVEL